MLFSEAHRTGGDPTLPEEEPENFFHGSLFKILCSCVVY